MPTRKTRKGNSLKMTRVDKQVFATNLDFESGDPIRVERGIKVERAAAV